MRLFTLNLALAALVLLAACGGGSPDGGSQGTLGGGTVTGRIVEIDNDAANLAGVRFSMRQTGETVTSAADGSFRFDGAAPSSFTLALVSAPRAARRSTRSDDDTPGSDDSDDDESDDEDDEDDIDDGDESTEDEVEIHRVGDGEHVHVRIRIRDGKIVRVEVSRSDRSEREVEIFMDRSGTSDDADIKGKLELEARDDREKLEVEVEHATVGRELEAFVIDPDGVEESLGILPVGALGKVEWERSTGDGDALPFALSAVADLEGYRVEVRDATDATVLLHVTVPELPAVVPDLPGEDDDDDDEGRSRGKSRLTAEVAGLEGSVEVRTRTAENRHCFEIEGEDLFAYAEVEFLIETAVDAGTFTSLGTRTVDVEGEAELELETSDGDALPNEATGASDLVGLRVEVRDVATGDLLLSGVVPALSPED